MRQLIAAPIRMIVGATLPSARVGEGLETTQLSRFVALPAWVCLGARPEALVLEYELPLSAESGHSGIGAPSLTKCLAELRDT
jgi:hypothetical protein